MSSLTFTLVQTKLYWEDKAANLRMLEEKIKGIREKTQVVLLPEMFSTGFSMKPETLAETMDGETVQWMKRIAAERRIILGGSLIVADGSTSNVAASGLTGEPHYYNRFVWMQPNGQYGFYNKRHLFAFAGENEHYTAGTERFIASVNGWRLNLQVCYDLRFPVWARNRMEVKDEDKVEDAFEYDALIYVANWPERRSLAWRTLLQARAIENQCFVIGVNRVGEDGNRIYHSGDSTVINPLGEILYHKKDEEDVFTITLSKEDLNAVREKFPFWRDGDKFLIRG